MGIVVTIALLMLGGWLYNNFSSTRSSYPLGNKIEYIGEEKYGCYLICDSSPNSTYYYATDMNVDEVTHYFKNTTLDGELRNLDGVIDFTIKNKDGRDISIYYYTNKVDVRNEKQLEPSNKQHILSIPSFDYQVAKSSL